MELWRTLLAVGISVLIFGLATLHFYWGCGGAWPQADRQRLAKLVVGIDTMPGFGACLVVAVLLCVGTILVMRFSGLIPLGSARISMMALALAGVFLLRGAVGFFETRLRKAIIGTPYARWNVILYSPLCVALGVGILALILVK